MDQSTVAALRAGAGGTPVQDELTQLKTEALLANPAHVVSLAPGVIDTDMQTDLLAGNPAGFPDQANFIHLKESGSLTSPADAAAKVLGFLARGDFGSNVVADVRD